MSTEAPLSSASESQPLRSTGRLNALQLASNRRNAQKSTGPRTKAGKYRSALNAENRRLLPESLERDLRARGEDPREFLRLHRDLVAIFHPYHPDIAKAVAMLASAWWQKARRIRQWVGAGAPRSPELDARIEALLVVVVSQMKKHHGPWQRRLIAIVGQPIGPPREARSKIESRLALFGAKPPTTKRRWAASLETGDDQARLEEYFDDLVREIIAEAEAKTSGTRSSEPERTRQA